MRMTSITMAVLSVYGCRKDSVSSNPRPPAAAAPADWGPKFAAAAEELNGLGREEVVAGLEARFGKGIEGGPELNDETGLVWGVIEGDVCHRLMASPNGDDGALSVAADDLDLKAPTTDPMRSQEIQECRDAAARFKPPE